MGSAASLNEKVPIQAWPIDKLIERITLWPDFTDDEQREYFLNACDILTFRARTPFFGSKWFQALLELRLPDEVIRGIEKYKRYEVVLRQALELLIVTCRKYEPIAARVLDLKILDLMDKDGEIMQLHADDEYIIDDQKDLFSVLSEVALKLAHEEIDHDVKAFLCCDKCGQRLDSNDIKGRLFDLEEEVHTHLLHEQKSGSELLDTGGILIHVKDRRDSGNLDEPLRHQLQNLRRIVAHMSTYPRQERVQEVGCTAIIAAARTGDALALTKGGTAEALAAAMHQFPQHHGIAWKVCTAAIELGKRGDDGVKSELGKRGVIEALVNIVKDFDDVEVKQTALFALGQCLDKAGNNFMRMKNARLEKAIRNAQKGSSNAKIKLHVPDELLIVFEEYRKYHPETPESDDKVAKDQKGKPWDPIKTPKNMFGTSEELFQGGVPGLV